MISKQRLLFDFPDYPGTPAPKPEVTDGTFEAEFLMLHQTTLAIAVSRDGKNSMSRMNTCWLSKSQIDWEISGTHVLVKVPKWLAEDKGLI